MSNSTRISDQMLDTNTIPPPIVLKSNNDYLDKVLGEVTIPRFRKVIDWVWWLLPDAVAIGAAILLSPVGFLNDPSLGTYLYNMIIYSVFLLYLTLVFCQSGPYRKNISRYIFESFPLRLLGYCSYALYIFQVILLCFYLYLVVEDIHEGRVIFALDIHSFSDWFPQQPDRYKVLAVTGVIGICYAIHKYYQDMFVAYIYTNYIMSWIDQLKSDHQLHVRDKNEGKNTKGDLFK